MPEVDGLALARAIGADPALAAIPLLMLSSWGRTTAEAARAAGIAAYLTKPVRPTRLLDELSRALAGGPATAPAPAVPAPAAAAAGAPLRRLRVLVAEDNAVNQRVVIRMLETAGCRVDAVANGREAVDAMARLPYDLVFMDCQMPEMDGYEASRAIRAAERAGASGRRVPIVALTANALQGDREQCLAAGMDDYLAKPITKDAFGASLRRWGAQGGPPTDGSIDATALAALAAIDGRAGTAEPARRAARRVPPGHAGAARGGARGDRERRHRRGAPRGARLQGQLRGARPAPSAGAVRDAREPGRRGDGGRGARHARGDGGRARPVAALAPRRALARQRADRGRGDLTAAVHREAARLRPASIARRDHPASAGVVAFRSAVS